MKLVSWPGEGGGQSWAIVVVIELAGDELLHVCWLWIGGSGALVVSLFCHLHTNLHTYLPQTGQTWIDPAIITFPVQSSTYMEDIPALRQLLLCDGASQNLCSGEENGIRDVMEACS